MTHDELLAKMAATPIDLQGTVTMYEALVAVVELHKPKETTPPWGGNKYTACNVCETGTNDGDYSLEYPCPTIEAIERELN
jgi:hypothetical protein